MHKYFKDWYTQKMQEATRLEEARNYAKAAGVEFNTAEWIRENYLVEKLTKGLDNTL